LITGAAKVSPKTRTRVVDAMHTLNFQPNEAARILAYQKKLKRDGDELPPQLRVVSTATKARQISTGGLCQIALPLLVSFCIAGSIVTALPVSRGSGTVSTRKEQITMAQGERKNWRELCKSALGAKDPDELLTIPHQLNQALKSEGQVRRDFREAMRTISPR
jgi:hypothetical protein